MSEARHWESKLDQLTIQPTKQPNINQSINQDRSIKAFEIYRASHDGAQPCNSLRCKTCFYYILKHIIILIKNQAYPILSKLDHLYSNNIYLATYLLCNRQCVDQTSKMFSERCNAPGWHNYPDDRNSDLLFIFWAQLKKKNKQKNSKASFEETKEFRSWEILDWHTEYSRTLRHEYSCIHKQRGKPSKCP